MPLRRPRREHEHDPRVALGDDRVPFVGLEPHDRSRTPVHRRAARLDAHLPVDDDEQRRLLDLMVAELLARREVHGDDA